MKRIISTNTYATFIDDAGRYWWQHRYRQNYYGSLVGPFRHLNEAMDHARKCVCDLYVGYSPVRGDDHAQ